MCQTLNNLLSISQTTNKYQNSIENFTQSDCGFQNLTLGRRIGNAKEHGELYHFEKDTYG